VTASVVLKTKMSISPFSLLPRLNIYAEKGDVMARSLLDGKIILAVNDDPDILAILEEEIMMAAPTCYLYKATGYQMAKELLVSLTYDLVILDIAFGRTLDLLSLAVNGPIPFPVTMLTIHGLFPEAMKRSVEMGVRAYFPKEKLTEIVPFLEDVLKYQSVPGWKRLFANLRIFFNARQKEKLTKPQGYILERGSENWGRAL